MCYEDDGGLGKMCRQDVNIFRLSKFFFFSCIIETAPHTTFRLSKAATLSVSDQSVDAAQLF